MTTNLTTTLTRAGTKVAISRDLPTVMIGERINPTGRKAVLGLVALTFSGCKAE